MEKRCEACRYSSAVKKEILNIMLCLHGEVYRTSMSIEAKACEKYEESYNAEKIHDRYGNEICA